MLEKVWNIESLVMRERTFSPFEKVGMRVCPRSGEFSVEEDLRKCGKLISTVELKGPPSENSVRYTPPERVVRMCLVNLFWKQ